jgi:hypothetical protein
VDASASAAKPQVAGRNTSARRSVATSPASVGRPTRPATGTTDARARASLSADVAARHASRPATSRAASPKVSSASSATSVRPTGYRASPVLP